MFLYFFGRYESRFSTNFHQHKRTASWQSKQKQCHEQCSTFGNWKSRLNGWQCSSQVFHIPSQMLWTERRNSNMITIFSSLYHWLIKLKFKFPKEHNLFTPHYKISLKQGRLLDEIHQEGIYCSTCLGYVRSQTRWGQITGTSSTHVTNVCKPGMPQTCQQLMKRRGAGEKEMVCLSLLFLGA